MTNPIHVSGTEENDAVQAIDVRLYFPHDADPEDVLDRISNALQDSSELYDMVGAYPLVGDGFGRLVPDTKPLA